MAYFPFMIQMDDKVCLVAGGGAVAYRKVKQMLQFGATVRVVAPDMDPRIRLLQERHPQLEVLVRKVCLQDLDGVDVVIMATDDAGLNTQYAEWCRRHRILVNVVDVKEDCGFYFPSVIRQGEVVVGISTGGSSPLLAAGIRRQLQSQMREDYGRIAAKMSACREQILTEETTEAARKQRFKKVLEQNMEEQVIRVGTRGSELARIQTDMVIETLRRKHPEYTYEVVVLSTKGDRQTDRTISSFGGKAVFVEEFEEALRNGTIDIAVHSAKDMPNPCGEDLTIAGVLKRACVQDVLIRRRSDAWDPASHAVIGTGSLRRRYQIQQIYPQAECRDLRGNIGTRIRKLKEKQYDAIILAAAGIHRQGLDQDPELVYEYLDIDQMLPAAGQAVIAVETRQGGPVAALVSDISDRQSERELLAEREVLSILGAGCHEPVGVLCRTEGEQVRIRLMHVVDGTVRRSEKKGAAGDWRTIARELAEEKRWSI